MNGAGRYLVVAAAAAAMWAQPAGSGARHSFGNVVFPGTGRPPLVRHGLAITTPGFAHNLSGIVSGFRPYTGAPFGRRGVGAFVPVYVPVAYPVLVGGYASPPPVNVVVVNSPPPQPVVINQNFGPEAQAPPRESNSGVTVYQAPSAFGTAPEPKPTVYLIAFKDGSIYSALAAWVEADTLVYVTTQGRLNKASLQLVDRELTEKLNRERGLELRLTPSR
ncbi:MAG: hypothetical protein RMK57_14635 [Bryobacterales bacterium]|nr:hypothetical protein [Bryobacteraceae bacterium]MDW8355757.1 hypothetical protein [Bryobacterales bacterium]